MIEFNNLPPVITMKEVTEILGINKDTAYRVAKQEDFPKLPVKKPILIPRDEFLRWARLIK
ncbi:MAG: helix-turn-helix domain-containing protein [Clostridium sp.]